MAHQICLVLGLLSLLGSHHSIAQECPKAEQANDCGSCISLGPDCAWCKYKYFHDDQFPRCGTRMSLQKNGCGEKDMVDPQSQHNETEKGERLDPRRIQLQLWPGRAHTFQVHVKPPRRQKPVDVYFLTSLSANNGGKGNRAKLLSQAFFQGIYDINEERDQKIEVNHLGYGLFGHTALTAKEQKQCEEAGQVCEPELHITHSATAPIKPGYWNRPWRTEAGLQALMQVALCKDLVKWGQNDRIVVYATDSRYQLAPDNKTETANSSICQMNSSHIQTKISPPSVSELRRVLLENNIQVIFAVSQHVFGDYASLLSKLPRARIVYVEFSDPKGYNFEEPFDRIRTSLVLTHSPVPGLSVTYIPLCDYSIGGEGNQGSCYPRGRHRKKTQIFNVTVTSETCVLPASFDIQSLNPPEKLTVELIPRCNCECGDAPDPEWCNYAGNPVCGKCRCDMGHFGSLCQCSTSDSDEPCRARPGAPVCSGRGQCICGQCECSARELPHERSFGSYCECDNFSCPRSKGQICGGHGKCECGTCVCEEDYVGDACDCSTSVDGCQSADGNLCSGRGLCQCNRCECPPMYTGERCEHCPLC
ncbi:integrin beta-2-like [Engraulis encrasicolus]|uniref:integrin beta-2-like n=1 Tax=Engraulis encrasicolus TaxID=184585 RepID=UPI002FD72042